MSSSSNNGFSMKEWRRLSGLADPYMPINEGVSDAIAKGVGGITRDVGTEVGKAARGVGDAVKAFRKRGKKSGDGSGPSDSTDSAGHPDSDDDKEKDDRDKSSDDGKKGEEPDTSQGSDDRQPDDRKKASRAVAQRPARGGGDGSRRRSNKNVSPFLRLARGIGKTIGGATGVYTMDSTEMPHSDSLWEQFLCENGIDARSMDLMIDYALESGDSDDIDAILALEGLFDAWRKRRQDQQQDKQQRVADAWKQAKSVRDKYGADATKRASQRGVQVGQRVRPVKSGGTSVNEDAFRRRVPRVRKDPSPNTRDHPYKNHPGKYEDASRRRKKDMQRSGEDEIARRSSGMSLGGSHGRWLKRLHRKSDDDRLAYRSALRGDYEDKVRREGGIKRYYAKIGHGVTVPDKRTLHGPEGKLPDRRGR